jgi:peptidoglycan/LPS O-acetylase OafA/YrhL
MRSLATLPPEKAKNSLSDVALETEILRPNPRGRTMRWPILGGVRFFLALVVAGAHCTLYAAPNAKVLALQYFSGLAAVIGFLVISGYSIAASYAKQKNGFYARRALRILPLYVASIAFSAAGPVLFTRIFGAPDFRLILANLFLLQGFFVKPIPINPVLWTLSLEAFFYLLTPLIARLSQRALIVIICISAAGYGLAHFLSLPFYSELLYGSSVLLLGWAWLLGFWTYRNAQYSHTFMIVQSIGVCAIALNNSFLMFLWPVTWTVTIIGIGYGCRVPYNRRIARFLSLLGDASYPLYLVHFTVFSFIKVFTSATSAYIYLMSAIAISILLDRGFDRPFKRLVMAVAAGKRSQTRATVS